VEGEGGGRDGGKRADLIQEEQKSLKMMTTEFEVTASCRPSRIERGDGVGVRASDLRMFVRTSRKSSN
jgi:hypothetical protein